MQHLSASLSGESFESLSALPRVPLLAHLKSLNVNLQERQRLATAVAKASRSDSQLPQQHAEQLSGEVAAASRVEPKPQGFTIYCHRTTLADGNRAARALSMR